MLFKRAVFDYIVVGLGNPGLRYAETRHNAGFMALDKLCEKLKVRCDRLRFEALCGEARVDGMRLLFMKPQTYMNLSGRSVAAAMKYYKLTPDRVVVIFDDVSLPVGRLRVRGNGSAGGHNGIKSLISSLGSQEFPRVKIGVGENRFDDLVDWVTSTFAPDERKVIDRSVDRAAEVALELCKNGVDRAAAVASMMPG